MTTKIRRWDPFTDLVSMQGDLNRLFGWTWGEGDARGWVPALDVIERPDAFEISVDLPGIDPADVEITVQDSTLTLSGSREFSSEVNEEQVHRVERRYGAFSRSLSLPKNVKADEIDAAFEEGVLTLRVPKAEEAKPKKISIKATG
jgi:HSP20 family protein